MTLLELLEDWLRDTVATGLALLSLLGVPGVAFTCRSRAYGVDGPMMDDRHQPRAYAGLGTGIPGGTPPTTEEGVLDDVFGQGRVTGDARCESKGHAAVSLVQCFQGGRIAECDARHQ